MKKKIALVTLVLILSFTVLAACGKSNSAQSSGQVAASVEHPVTIKFGMVDLPPFGDIVDLVQSNLKKQGINLEVKKFTDVIVPNQALNSKELDINFFQNKSYLEAFNASNKMNLVPLSTTFSNIFGAYSKKHKSIEELPDGATITIPVDPASNGRALALLESHGLIKLKEGVDFKGSQQDIIENKKKFKFVEVEQQLLSQAYNDSDLTAMAGTYALKANLIPARDALIKEKYRGDRFLTVVAARPDNQNDVNIQTVAKAFASDDVKKLLQEKYSDTFIWKSE